MKLYKVLVVDDEQEARTAIVNKLDWQALGFEVVAEADNGQDALELTELLQPDVIMTDIQMPFMDGLTFCKKAKKLLPSVKIAVFSGFDEFEYAKEAIRLEVEEYILKPINAQELTEVFRRIRQALDDEIQQRQNFARLQQHYEKSLPLMRQQLLSNILMGQVSAELATQRAADYGFSIAAERYCVAIVHFDANDISNTSHQLLSVSLQQMIAEYLENTLPYHEIRVLDNIGLIFMLPKAAEAQQVMEYLNQIFVPAKKLLGLRLSIGIGNVFDTLEKVPQSYTDANDALSYQILVDPGQCIYLRDIEPFTSLQEYISPSFLEDIIRQIKIGSTSSLETSVQAFLRYCKKSSLPKQQYQIFFLELSAELLNLIKAYKLEKKKPEIAEELLQQPANHFSSLETVGRWLMDYCNKLRILIRSERKDTTTLLVEKAKEEVLKSFADSSFSMEQLCGELGVSPTYFSTIFKKETGLNFVAYLTQLRLEQAVEFLNNSDAKTYEIAEKVGYIDPNYFSYVFKKNYGVSPSKYRLTSGANR